MNMIFYFIPFIFYGICTLLLFSNRGDFLIYTYLGFSVFGIMMALKSPDEDKYNEVILKKKLYMFAYLLILVEVVAILYGLLGRWKHDINNGFVYDALYIPFFFIAVIIVKMLYGFKWKGLELEHKSPDSMINRFMKKEFGFTPEQTNAFYENVNDDSPDEFEDDNIEDQEASKATNKTKINENDNSETKQIKKKIEQKKNEITAIFKKSPDAIAKFLPQAVVLKLLINLVGGDIKKYTDYYGKLLFYFTKDHFLQSALLIDAIVEQIFVEEDESFKSFFTAVTIVGVGTSILAFRNELQTKEIKKALSGYHKDYTYRDIIQKEKVFTSDGNTFYEVFSKYGDDPRAFKTFSFTRDGTRKYANKEIDISEKHCSSSELNKAFENFVNEKKLYDVTECMRADSKNFTY